MSEGELPGGEGETVNKLADNASRVGIWPHIFALLAYLVMALAVTYPAVLHFTTAVPGDLLADRDQNLWNLWWVKEALSQGANPFHTDLLYYPYGVDLYYHTLALPLGLIGLLPQLLLGLPAAYNAILLVAFTLSGYGAFRLALFVTRPQAGEQRPGIVRLLAAFLAGVVFAFTPYTLDALKGQPEVLSLQWMPFYVEIWLRAMDERRAANDKRRWLYAALAGIFLALAAYSSLYYAVYLVIFTIAHVAYRLFVVWRRGRSRQAPGAVAQEHGRSAFPAALRYSVLVTLIAAGTALALTLPMAVGLAANHNNPRLAVVADLPHRLSQSADLLSFIAPSHDHLAFGTWQDQPGVNEPPIHDYVGLGYAALALAIIGSVAGWRAPGVGAKFWAGLGLLAMVLAMGPELQVDRNLTGIPLPFALLASVPGMDAIAKPERFVVLARLCMSLLAAIGVVWIIMRITKSVGSGQWAVVHRRSSVVRPWTVFAIIFILLMVELPIHPRYIGPYSISQGFDALAEQPSGGLMELPFATQQVDVIGRRMLDQTVHGKPIMAGYLARNYDSPIIDSCSPFWGFISPLDVPRQDIASPLVVNRLQDVLTFYGIKYLALYTNYGGSDEGPVDPKEMAALQSIVKAVAPGQPFYTDDYMSLHNVTPTDLAGAPPSFHAGDGWYNIEQSEGVPFRWAKEGGGTLCVFAPHKVTAPLKLEATAFAREQPVAISIGGRQVYSRKLPPGPFTPITTGPIEWQPGMTEVQIAGDMPGVSPKSLDPASHDERPLTIGLRRVSLADDAQK